MEDKYLNHKKIKKKFYVSTQYYSFAVKAFINVVDKDDSNEYDFSIRETKTHEIIEDVSFGRSEIGILYLNDLNIFLVEKALKEWESIGTVQMCEDLKKIIKEEIVFKEASKNNL